MAELPFVAYVIAEVEIIFSEIFGLLGLGIAELIVLTAVVFYVVSYIMPIITFPTISGSMPPSTPFSAPLSRPIARLPTR